MQRWWRNGEGSSGSPKSGETRGNGYGDGGGQRGAPGSGRGSGRDCGLRESSGALFIGTGKAREGGGAGGTRRATCPRVGDGAVPAGAAKAHGKWREGDEEEADAAQRPTETSNVRRRTEEEDRSEEGDDGYSSALFDRWHDSSEKKTKGARGPGGRRRRGGAVGH